MTLIQIIPICLSSCAILLNLLFRYRDKKKKKLYYIIKNELIIENKKNDEKLVLTYGSEKITQLVKTEILIFNKSNKTIEYSELGKTELLQLKFSKGTKIFSVEISEFDNQNVNFSFKQDEISVKLYFDYFKNENYVLLKIITNEKSTEKPEMLGEIIKDGEIIKFNKPKYLTNELIRLLPFVFIGSLIILIICENLKMKTEYLLISGLIYGFAIVDVIRFFINKIIDKRIMNFIKG